jgi:hypothetical protein
MAIHHRQDFRNIQNLSVGRRRRSKSDSKSRAFGALQGQDRIHQEKGSRPFN